MKTKFKVMKTKFKVGDLVKVVPPGYYSGRVPFSPFPWKINDPETVWAIPNETGLIVAVEEADRTYRCSYGVLVAGGVASINDDYLRKF